jgi:hypothetical protein
MRGPETRLTKKIRTAIEREYPDSLFMKIHISAFQNVGIPDLLGCVSGRFFAMEIKTPRRRNKVRPAQQLMLNRIKKAKGVCGVVTSPEEALDLISEALP